MSSETPEYEEGKMPLRKAWAIFTWYALIPTTVAVLMLLCLGLAYVFFSYSDSIDSWYPVIGCMVCGIGALLLGFLLRWHQALEAKRESVNTSISKRMVLDAARETYNSVKEEAETRYKIAKSEKKSQRGRDLYWRIREEAAGRYGRAKMIEQTAKQDNNEE